MIQSKQKILPLKHLFHKAGIAGYLFLIEQPLSFLTTRQRDLEDYASVDGAAMISIAYTMICFAYCFFLIFKPKGRYIQKMILKTPLIYLFLFISFCILSALWSPNFALTAYRGFECLSMFLIICAVLSELRTKCSKQDMIEWIVMWVIWVILWRITLLVVKFHDFSYLYYPFRAGRLNAGVFFFLALFISKRRLFNWIILSFNLLSGERKNYWGIAFGLIPGLVVGNSKAKLMALFLVGIAILSFMIGGMDVIQNTLFYGKEGVGMEYTTGRDKLWTFMFELGMRKPILGYGFVVGESNAIMVERGLAAISSHNMLLSAFLGVGVLGPILLLCFFAKVFLRCLSDKIPNLWKTGLISTVIMCFVIANTGPGLGGRVYGSWVANVLVFVTIVVLSEMKDPEKS